MQTSRVESIDTSRRGLKTSFVPNSGVDVSKNMYGGQAVIEGVMMRGKKFVACAVRAPQGDILTTSEPLSSFIYASQWAKIPFLRAVTIMWDTVVLGTRMLMWAANIAVGEEENSGNKDSQKIEEKKDGTEKAQAIPAAAALGTVAIALVFGIGLFFVLPLFLTNLADPFITTSLGGSNPGSIASANNFYANLEPASLVSNLLEGVIRFAIFLAYIYLIGLMPDVRRVFQYHGAEHKTIAAEEAGAPLTADSIQKFSKEHPRCGTGFLLTVVVVSIFVFALLGKPPVIIRFASRIVLVPVVVALSYELIKFSSAHRSFPLFNWFVVRPSLALQSLTTREPEAKMIEVAVRALETVKREEGNSQTEINKKH